MAYKGKSITVASGSHLVNEIKDFLVSCGWTNVTPSGNDDDEGLACGFFLRSSGESGQDDIHVHLGLNQNRDGRDLANFSYMNDPGGISDTDTEVIVQDATVYEANSIIRIENELMQVGAVDTGNNKLTGLTRGLGITDPASHADGKVVQQVRKGSSTWSGYFLCDIFARREWNADKTLIGPIAASSGTIAWALGKTSVTGVTGLTGYGDDRFNWHSYIQVWDPDGGGPGVPGADHGKLRWITDCTTGGNFTYQPFKTAPGSKHCHILSSGFLPPWSRRSLGSGLTRYLGTADVHYNVAGSVVYMYGNKDAFFICHKASWGCFYYGNVIPLANPLNALTTADLSIGATSMNISNTDIFTPGQKYRIISQNVLDWDANKSVPTPVMDPEECPTQEIVCQTVGAGSITFTPPLIFSFKSGAVVGEDPRPAIQKGYGYYDYLIGNTTYNLLTCYLNALSTELAVHRSHRQVYRAFHSASPNQNTPYDNQYSYIMGTIRKQLEPAEQSFESDNSNRQNEQLLLYRPVAQFIPGGSEATYSQFGVFFRAFGLLHFVWLPYAQPLGAALEDTVKAMWNGKFETFRVLYNTGGSPAYLICGPEIA